MPESGQRARRAATGPPVTIRAATSRAFALLGAACAVAPALAMWGFTVDDALIPVRYAHNLASGAGYRFDAHGVSTDGVTPLPWAFVLAPLAATDPMSTLVRAKVLGIAAWAIGGGVLGARVGAIVSRPDARGVERVLAAAALVVMGLAFPVGAWAASGLETGVATAIATIAVTRLARPKQAAALAGLAAAFRPEMVVWALAIAVGAAILASERENENEREQRRTGNSERRLGEGVAPSDPSLFSVPGSLLLVLQLVLLAALPFVICAGIRLVVFGRPAPLAVLAKPSDFAHGALYVVAASLVVLTPLLVVAPVVLLKRREAAIARVILLAFVAHALAVLAAGGDWMPYARMMVPVAPSLVLAVVDLGRVARPAWGASRLAAATVLGVLLAARAAPAGRHVLADRADLVARARPALAGARVVAALDVGWVSAATDARIVDLAGLTDPSIAVLGGGHTSKRVDVAMLLDRGVDTVVVYSDVRAVEARIVDSELFASRFEPAETLPLGSRGASYRIYRRLRP